MHHLRRKQQRGLGRTGLRGRFKSSVLCSRSLRLHQDCDSRQEQCWHWREELKPLEVRSSNSGDMWQMRDSCVLGSDDMKLGAALFGKGGNGENALEAKRGARTHPISRELWEKVNSYHMSCFWGKHCPQDKPRFWWGCSREENAGLWVWEYGQFWRWGTLSSRGQTERGQISKLESERKSW